MSATPHSFEFDEEDIEGGGLYSDLEPGDYVGTLVKVSDYDNRSEGRTNGWVWEYQVEGLSFKDWTAFTSASRWKVLQVLRAFGVDVEAGIAEVDPNAFVGMEVGVTIGWQNDPDTHDPDDGPNYKTIEEVYAIPSDEPPAL